MALLLTTGASKFSEFGEALDEAWNQQEIEHDRPHAQDLVMEVLVHAVIRLGAARRQRAADKMLWELAYAVLFFIDTMQRRDGGINAKLCSLLMESGHALCKFGTNASVSNDIISKSPNNSQ